ncbi:hypothetical protein VP01_3754g2 [Puccinia sorghi]|uniref:Uncharacterized protein n=1 Tax=Puccinia sorghi TaxID=27349 RepID=A0A0L6UTT4_9BASI|nr:hypothetical protein VP01_3754g2 [Puccinia sorghi]
MDPAHCDIKSHLLGSQYNFITFIKLMTNSLEAKYHKLSAQWPPKGLRTRIHLKTAAIVTPPGLESFAHPKFRGIFWKRNYGGGIHAKNLTILGVFALVFGGCRSNFGDQPLKKRNLQKLKNSRPNI